MPRFPFTDWVAEQLRLSIFPPATDSTRSPDWWQEMVGAEPEEISMSPKKGTGVVAGSYESGKLLLRLEPDRVDWLMLPPDQESDSGLDFHNIGQAPESIRVFSELAQRWFSLPNVPAVTRIAFGGVLLHPEEDKRSSYERLGSYLPFNLNPDVSDFVLQINLPKVPSRLEMDGLALNRLSKWTSVFQKDLSLSIGQDIDLLHSRGPQISAIRLEFDTNTVPTFRGEIPRERLFELFQELVEQTISIATDGIVGQR